MEETRPEFIVASILSRKLDKNSKEMLWRVCWEGYPDKTWEPRSSFVSEDGSINDVWSKYEDLHPHRRPVINKPKKKKKSTQ